MCATEMSGFHKLLRYKGGLVAFLVSMAIIGCAPVSTLNPSAQMYKLSPSVDGGYDYNTFLVKGHNANLEGILRSMVTLISVTEFETATGDVHRMGGQATGVVIFDRFVLTVDHAVSNYKLEVPFPYGAMAASAALKKQETYIVIDGEKHRLDSLIRDKDNDIALFSLPPDVRLPSFPYQIGNSDELRIGNFIYVVGNPLNMGYNVREGIVSNLRAPEAIHAINALPDNTFMVSNGLNPGDSGTPAIAIRDGMFELVGLTQGTFLKGQRLGWVLRINKVMDRIQSHIGPVRTAGHLQY